VYRDANRFSDAVAAASRASKLEPNSREICANYGAILADFERFDDALRLYERALSIAPTHTPCNWGKALALLGKSQFADAWPFYESRINNPKLGIKPPATGTPQWRIDGERKRVLILQEQGLGDAIFFSRMLAQASSEAEKITLRVDRRLVDLLQRSNSMIDVIGDDVPVSAISHEQSLLMGSLFNVLTDAKGSAVDYVQRPYIYADPDRATLIQRQLKRPNRLLCGVFWRSFRPDGGVDKSIALENWTQIFGVDGVDFVSLQHGDVENEIGLFNDRSSYKLSRCGSVDNRTDIDGVAALIDACDFVIGVSSTAAHIAGALGKPGVILLPRGRGRLFYWNNRKDLHSYWYPTLALADQDWDLSWNKALGAATHALRAFV